ncbi:MAG: ferredoxin [Acidobacteriota bacterium]
MVNGRGRGQGGGGRRSQSGNSGLGPSGNCACVKCGYSSPKEPRVPCMDRKCPDCGAVLFREGGSHYLSAMKNKK